MPNSFRQQIRLGRAVFILAVKKFFHIDGLLWAESFSFNAFLSLFPLLILFVTISSYSIERQRTEKVIIGYVERYVAISGEMRRNIVDNVSGVVEARGQAGALAGLLLVWTAVKCFVTLTSAINRAWGCTAFSWRLPVKSLALFSIMGVAGFLSVAVPMLAAMIKHWFFPAYSIHSWVYGLANFFIPLLTVFFTLSLFYKFAPVRFTRLSEVWAGALIATALLRITESTFLLYLKNFSALNAVYGALGGIAALLLWIYLSGCIFVFGACLCASRSEITSGNAPGPDCPGARAILPEPAPGGGQNPGS